jgi:hypothetical protein
MTVARSVGDVLSEHTVFEVESIDRMYVNVYVPGLQYAPGLVGYVQRQLGLPIASTAPLARITDAFSTAVHRFARSNAVAWVDFAKGQRKDDVMHEHLARFSGTEGVLFVGRAQEPLRRQVVGQEDVGGLGDFVEHFLTAGCSDIDPAAALAAVRVLHQRMAVGIELKTTHVDEAALGVAAAQRVLDVDDVGSPVGQDRSGRGHERELGDFEDSDSLHPLRHRRAPNLWFSGV